MIENTQQNVHQNIATLIAVLLALVFGVSAHAEKMTSTLQEAIYRFEMKGEVDEAHRLLTNVISNGDEQDIAAANFYLAKIHELQGHRAAANIYYNQSLKLTNETAKAYWISEQEAATRDSYEFLLKQKINLKSPIQKIFNANSTYLQLFNGALKKVEADSIIDISETVPSESEILQVDDSGIWYQTPEKDSLHYKPFNRKSPERTYPVSATTNLLSHGEYTLAQSNHAISLLNKKNVRAQIFEKYTDCSLAGFYTTTEHFILNCTDNTLHFLSVQDLSETYTINLFDVIQKVIVDKNSLYLFSGNNLYCYQPKHSSTPLWKHPFNHPEDIVLFEDHLAILESSGRVTLVNKFNGTIITAIRSDASNIYPLAIGTLGLFTSEGAVIAIDTLFRPLWNFNFSKPISSAPIRTKESLFLPFDNQWLQGIKPTYYGKKPLQSDRMVRDAAYLVENERWESLPTVLDSILKLEPGNAEGWLFKALYLEHANGNDRDKQKAWSEAVRLSVSNPQATAMILSRYSKAIKAKFVSLLNISPKTKYPQFFGNKKNLYTVDPAAEHLLTINADNGELRSIRPLPKMDNSPVMENDDNTLILAAGFTMNILDLNHDNRQKTIQLPGKAFDIKIAGSTIYVSTWNGFLLKYAKADGRLFWSRKIAAVPVMFEKIGEDIYVVSLEGDINCVWDASGQLKSGGTKLHNNVSQMARTDSVLAIASINKLFLYQIEHSEKDAVQILMESSIASLQSLRFQEKDYLLLGLSDQSLYLYTIEGAPVWKYQGKNSIFTKPFVFEKEAWLDQGNEVVSIQLKDGNIKRRFSTPGGAGTPFILNRTLYSASSKRLLYGFGL